jgi:hypothetical protein
MDWSPPPSGFGIYTSDLSLQNKGVFDYRTIASILVFGIANRFILCFVQLAIIGGIVELHQLKDV